MNARLAVLALVVVVAVIVGTLLSRGSAPGAVDPTGPAARTLDVAASADDASPLPDPAGAPGGRIAAEQEVTSADVLAGEPGTKPAAPDAAALTHVVGRLLLPGGAPAAGAELGLRGGVANDERAQKYGEPEDWDEVLGAADAGGRFGLAFDAPRAFQFTLTARTAGHAALSWRWSSLEPGSTTDIGTRTFVRACTVAGRVVDAAGAPTGIPWSVVGASEVGAAGRSMNGTRVSAPADRATGRFELNGVPEGPVSLSAYSTHGNWIDGPTVTANPGAVTEAEIVYRGPDLSSTITVNTSCWPFYTFTNPVDGRIVARAADGTEYVAEKIAGSSQTHAIVGLPEGVYTVEVTSAVHEPWIRTGVTPGSVVDARLEGGARVALAVVDDATGEPVERYRARLRFEGPGASSNTFVVVEGDEDPPPGGLLERLIPWDTTLLVDAEGYALTELPLGVPPAGTTTSAEARLSRGASVTVEVLDGAGAPAPGVEVTLHPAHPGYDPRKPMTWPRDHGAQVRFRAAQREGTTGADGSVTFDAVTAGPWGLFAMRGAVSVVEESVTLEDGAIRRVTLRLPASGALRGRITGGLPGAFAGTRIRATYLGGQSTLTAQGRRAGDTGEVDVDGRFALDDLAAGTHRLELLLPSSRIPNSRNSSGSSRSAAIDVGAVEVRPGEPNDITVEAPHAVPGTIVVRATHNGAPATGLVLHLTLSEGSGYEGRVLGAEPEEVLSPFLPGTWELSIRSLDAPWRYEHPEPVELAPGGRVEVDLAVVTGRGRLVILDAATGARAETRQVYLSNGSSMYTDGDGVIEFELTGSTLRLSGKDPFFHQGTGVDVPWGPDGPAVESIALEF